MSDGLHNFTDGLGIGAAFMAGPMIGLSTTIAVFVHEVPQEFGDFALLIKAGFTKRKALAWNLLSGLLAVLGTVIGCAVASTDAEPWILAFVAGTFFYVALSDVIPELNHDTGVIETLLQLFGILAGFIIMAGLVLAEMKLTTALAQNQTC
jgi:zinc transporter ZupT